MSGRRANPYRVKQHYSYTVHELAAALAVHRNTVRHWQRNGLELIDTGRPLLFHGQSVRDFLICRNKARKHPCPPGTLYCLRCRQRRAPALGMVDFVAIRAGTGNLRALCEACEGVMHRRVRQADIAAVMPRCTVQTRQGPSSLIGLHSASLNCDEEQRG